MSQSAFEELARAFIYSQTDNEKVSNAHAKGMISNEKIGEIRDR